METDDMELKQVKADVYETWLSLIVPLSKSSPHLGQNQFSNHWPTWTGERRTTATTMARCGPWLRDELGDVTKKSVTKGHARA